MSIWLKQSTVVTVMMGPTVDPDDAKTPYTTAIPAATIRVSKNGTPAAAKSEPSNSTHSENGYHRVTLNATDTNTLGALKVMVTDTANYLSVWENFLVVPANVWDSWFGTDKLQVDTMQWLGNAVTAGVGNRPAVDAQAISGDVVAADNLEADYDGTGYTKTNSTIGTTSVLGPGAIAALSFQANSITAGAIAADALADKGNWNIGKTNYSLSANQTGVTIGFVNTANSTNNLGTLALAGVKGEVDTGLKDIHLDHLLAVDYDPVSKPGVATALLNELVQDNGSGVSQFTSIALALAPTSGGLSPTDTAELRHRLGMSGTRTDPGAIAASVWTPDATALIEDDEGLQYTSKAMSQAPSGGGGLTAQEVWTYGGPEGRQVTGGTIGTVSNRVTANTDQVGGVGVSSPDDLKADVSGLSSQASVNAIDSKIGAPVSGDLASDNQVLSQQIADLPILGFDDVWNGQLTESYAGLGQVPSPAQALLAIQQYLHERAVAGTTVTVKDVGQGSTAQQFLLNSDTQPSSQTRSA